MSEVETAVQEPEVEVNPLADLVDAALAKDYNKANEIFGSAISVKLSDVMDQERIKISGQIFNGDAEDEDDMEDDEDDEGDMEDFNIIISALTGGGMSGADASDMKAIEDDKDEECNSDDEKLFMKENYETISIPNVEKKVSDKKTKKDKQSKRHNKSDKSDASETVDAETEYKDLVELKKQLSAQFQSVDAVLNTGQRYI